MQRLSGGLQRRFVALAAALTGSALAFFPSCETVATTVNPCGTIFGFCDPVDVDRLFGDIPDFDLDPTCSIPFFGLDNAGQGGGGGGGQNLGICSGTPIFPFTPGPRP